MRTEELVDLLSTSVSPTHSGVAMRRITTALLVAAIGACLLMVTVYGVRPDIASVTPTPLFWGKLAFPFVLSVGALFATTRLSRPGASARLSWPIIATPIACVWVAGIAAIITTTPKNRMLVLLGHSWQSCPFNILLLSIPGFVAIFLAVRALAPTQLRQAGAASGLLAGAVASVAYCFHCPEMSPTFWSVWYLLGMALSAACGALLGPKLLRW